MENMNKQGKVKENVSNDLNVLIKDHLKTMLNQDTDLCGILERLGLAIEIDSKSSDPNVILKDNETSNDMNKQTKKTPDFLQLSRTSCSSSETSKTSGVNTTDYELICSSSDEMEAANSTIIYLDNGSDTSASDTEIYELSDCSSETSNTAIKSWNCDSDASSSSCEMDESYYDEDTLDGFEETFVSTIKYEDRDNAMYTTYMTDDQAFEALQFKMLF